MQSNERRHRARCVWQPRRPRRRCDAHAGAAGVGVGTAAAAATAAAACAPCARSLLLLLLLLLPTLLPPPLPLLLLYRRAGGQQAQRPHAPIQWQRAQVTQGRRAARGWRLFRLVWLGGRRGGWRRRRRIPRRGRGHLGHLGRRRRRARFHLGRFGCTHMGRARDGRHPRGRCAPCLRGPGLTGVFL